MSEVWRVYAPVMTRVGETTSRAVSDKLQEELGKDAVVVARFSDEETALLRKTPGK